jgi:hypothetical protein
MSNEWSKNLEIPPTAGCTSSGIFPSIVLWSVIVEKQQLRVRGVIGRKEGHGTFSETKLFEIFPHEMNKINI